MKNPQDRKPTLEDVARKASVSLMTASRVVNSAPSVKAATRKRVLDAIAEIGYEQNEAGRLLRGHRAKMIGIIVPDLSDVFFATCAHTIQQIARFHQYMTLVVSSERDADLELQEAEVMANRKVAGLLIATSVDKPSKRLRDLQKSGIAMVAFDRPFNGIDTDSVLVENRLGAEMAVQHLVQHGHRKIACVGYDTKVYTVRERMEGYKSAMASAGLEPILLPEMTRFEDVQAWITKLAKVKDRLTAIFSLNHRTSTQLLRALSFANISIPGDMALIGFDDFDLAEVVASPLTVITQSPVEMVRRATSLLFEQIDSDPADYALPAKVLLPVQLIIRSSCGCTGEAPQVE
jgi:LacI family transcriptional regulator